MIDPARFGPPRELTGPEAAEQAGVDYEFARSIWRALGLVEVPPHAVEFSERDVAALRGIKVLMDSGVPLRDLLTATRVYGMSLATIADVETRIFGRHFLGADTEATSSQEQLEAVVVLLLDVTAELLEHAHRRHLEAALEGLSASGPMDGSHGMAAAFVDLVGFSRMSDHLPDEELEALVESFESLAVSRVVESGCRLVKVIGDAVMFVAPRADSAVDAAMSIVNEAGDREDMPPARAGVDFGQVLPVRGDYFGRTVNVAARITAFARPGTVVVSKDVVEEATRLPPLSRIGSPRLKGVGRVTLFKVRDGSDG